MKKIDLLKELMAFQIKTYGYAAVGNRLYFSLNENNIAVAELINPNKPNEYNGISIACISKRYGKVDSCNLMFSDIFSDSNGTATITTTQTGSGFEWYKEPTTLDKFNMSDQIERYFQIINTINVSPIMTSDFPFLGTSARFDRHIVDVTPSEKNHDSEMHYLDEPMDAEEQNYESSPELLEVVGDEAPDSNEPKITEDPQEPIETFEPYEDTSVIDETPEDDKNITEPLFEDVQALSTEVSEDTDFAPKDKEEPVPNVEEISNKETVIAVAASISGKEKSEQPHRRNLFDRLFGKKEAKPLTVEEKTEELFKEEEESDDGISEEGFFTSWEIGYKTPKDMIASLKKAQDGSYELHIIGKGRMLNFSQEANDIPWQEYSHNLQLVIIYDGITNIGDNAFKSHKALKQVRLADSVKMIGNSAFEYCSELEIIRLSKSLEIIGKFAFAGCEKLLSIILPDRVHHIDDYGFEFFDANGDNIGLIIQCKDPNSLVLGDGLNIENFIPFKNNDNSNWASKKQHLFQ